MPQLTADWYFTEIEASTAGLAEILAEHDQSLPIPTCPEWTLRQLVTHVGRAHRWAAEITRTRSHVFIPFREVPDGRLPVGAHVIEQGVAHVIDQGLACSCSTGWRPWLSWCHAGRVFCWAGSWVRS
jgi:hypothetical protein